MKREEAIRIIEATRIMLLRPDNQPVSDLYEALGVILEEKCGKWIEEFCSYQCSLCHCHISEETFDDYRKPNYCPNCGARMVSDD